MFLNILLTSFDLYILIQNSILEMKYFSSAFTKKSFLIQEKNLEKSLFKSFFTLLCKKNH